jgi:hypothetical protein
MYLRKFYINDITVIAPLKSATRWLFDRAEHSEFVYIDDLKKDTDQSHYFLYREGVSHLESALFTDWVVNNYDLDKTIYDLLNYRSPHWRGDLYENIHLAWCYNKFKMIDYINVSNLVCDWSLNTKMYDFSHNLLNTTKETLLNTIDTETLSLLYGMADNNNYWLQEILNGNDRVLGKYTVERFEEKYKEEIQTLMSNIDVKEKEINKKQEEINELIKYTTMLKSKVKQSLI